MTMQIWTRDKLEIGGTIHETATGKAWTIIEVNPTGKTRIEVFGKMSDRSNRQRTREYMVTLAQ